jgi:hypothetical protein
LCGKAWDCEDSNPGIKASTLRHKFVDAVDRNTLYGAPALVWVDIEGGNNLKALLREARVGEQCSSKIT